MSGSSWSCSKCTFLNLQSQKSRCEICFSLKTHLTQHPQSPSMAASVDNKWSCPSCTFLNPYTNSVCVICGARDSTILLSALELSQDEIGEAHLGSSVFLPLKSCAVRGGFTDLSGESKAAVLSPLPSSVDEISPRKSPKHGFTVTETLKPCRNKRKESIDVVVDYRGFVATKAVGESVQGGPSGYSRLESKTWKIMTYNVWFREDLEMYSRMKALGNLIQLHSLDVICLQEVTPDIYKIFRKSKWWNQYSCSISDESMFPGAYFCMQLSKVPVKSYTSRPFLNSIMGRKLLIAEVAIQPDISMQIATSHLESPCPAPPKWDQMFSKERVVQANEAIAWLGRHDNVIFCGDMNWDDNRDGVFPLPDGWIDAWTELRPRESGFTYDTKANKMLSGNRSLQKRLDRFVCKLKDLKVRSIEMIGKEEIPGIHYMKEKRVKGEVKRMELPVLPSDHYGLILTIASPA